VKSVSHVVLLLASIGALGLAIASATARERALPAGLDTPLRYVALGDSTVEGVGATARELNYVSRLHARLRARYPASELANLGVAGATSADVVRGQLDAAIARAPHLVTLSIGPNDITQRVPVEAYERNLETIFGRLRGGTDAVIVASLLPDLGITPRFRDTPERDDVARASVAFNDALRRRAAAHGVTLVDLWAPSRAEVPRDPALVAGDGYHPSDAGYARWAELTWAAIAPLIPAR